MKKLLSMFLAATITLSCFCVVTVSAVSGQDIVNEAKKWIGTKYGHSDGSGGPGTLVDCCGLVLQVYKKFGYNLYWSASSQAKEGSYVDKSSLQPGDIVCMSYSSGEIGHVGIYVGNDTMIHAPGTGKVVQYGNSISSWTYNDGCKLEYGRRLINSSTKPNNTTIEDDVFNTKPNGISNPNTTLRWKELNSKYNTTTKELQECLNYIIKAGLKVDGIYGIETHDAVKVFQGKYGLTVDGDAGPKTLSKVNEVLKGTSGGTHTHSFWIEHEKTHAHREYKRCACGYTEYTGKTVVVDTCSQCTTPGKPSLLNMKKEYDAGTEIKFTWNPTANTTHYNLYISKQGASGEYEYYENVFYAESGMTRVLGVGKYKVFLQPTNSKAWTDDKSTWRFTNSDVYYFDVIKLHEHDYEMGFEPLHPHAQYRECIDCGDIEFTEELKKVKSCEKCYPHEHDYSTQYEDEHPHEIILECDCGDIQSPGGTKKIIDCDECYPPVQKKTLKLQIGIPNMYVDGISQEIDPGRGTAPVIQNDRTLLPIRMVAESFGAYVVWDENENMVTIYAGDTTMNFWINSDTAVVNNRKYTLEAAPVIINERTFMPLRFIAENMGLNVGWNSVNQTVTVEGEIS